MNSNLPMNGVPEILASIRESISQANWDHDAGRDAGWRIQTAFVHMRIFLEAAGLTEALKAVQRLEATARKDWVATEYDEETAEDYLVWGAKLYQYLRAIEAAFAEPETSIVTKDIVQILQATQYSITDKACFPQPPSSESDVHARIEAVLRCVFPDLIHKPPIAKQIKHFQPDTGLPSIGTLIEYKFIANRGDVKRIADEILADTRGYLSKDWKRFIYVIYETKRFKPENQWRQLLRQSEIKTNTEILVISGEEPKRGRKPKKKNGKRV
jgi:hypothetical protein